MKSARQYRVLKRERNYIARTKPKAVASITAPISLQMSIIIEWWTNFFICINCLPKYDNFNNQIFLQIDNISKLHRHFVKRLPHTKLHTFSPQHKCHINDITSSKNKNTNPFPNTHDSNCREPLNCKVLPRNVTKFFQTQTELRKHAIAIECNSQHQPFQAF